MENRRKKTQHKTARKNNKKFEEATTFAHHVAELRKRLFYVGILFLIGSVLAYVYRSPLLSTILKPLDNEKLVYLTPGGGFAFIFQISIYAGIVFALPALVYHIFAFVRPALPVGAQKSIPRITAFSSALILAGIAYGYFIAIPASIAFLNTFADGAVTPNLTADSYLSFFLAYVGGLAVLSLIPLVIMFIHWIRPMTPGSVIKSEQWIVLASFVLAAIITPTPDVINQLMIAGPVIGVYQIGVVIVLFNIAQSYRRSTKAAKVATAALETGKPNIEALLNVETLVTPASAVPEMMMPATQPRQPTVSINQPRSLDGIRTRQRPSPLRSTESVRLDYSRARYVPRTQNFNARSLNGFI